MIKLIEKQCDRIYLVAIEGKLDGPFKIGTVSGGRCATFRLRDLQTGSPDTLVLIGQWLVPLGQGRTIERQLLRYFRSNHLRGEWFGFPFTEFERVMNLLGLERVQREQYYFAFADPEMIEIREREIQ